MTMRDQRKYGGLVNFGSPITTLIRSRELVYYMTRQRIVLRYRGSLLGAFWVILSPALMLAIYTLVFGVIFKPRWATESTQTTEYALLLYLGLCAFWFVSECVAEAPGLIAQHTNYVKKVVFPLEVLVWVSVCAALFHSTIRLGVFAVALLLFEGHWPPTILLIPFAWMPLILMTLGLCWAVSAIGVFVRDLGELVSLALTAMLFLSPVFYSIGSVPESFRWLIHLNPLTQPITHLREVAYFGSLPELSVWLITLGGSYLAAWAGYSLFLRSRKAFADVL